jgi:hypothetical protein
VKNSQILVALGILYRFINQTMKAFLHSFVAGLGSVLSIFPSGRAVSHQTGEMEAIGADFSRVGNDLQSATNKFSSRISRGQHAAVTHGKAREEKQLDLIPS